MMLLSLHVVAVGMLILVVGTLAYRFGYDKAERRYRRVMARMEGEEYSASRTDGREWN
jgi:hypothetical protein